MTRSPGITGFNGKFYYASLPVGSEPGTGYVKIANLSKIALPDAMGADVEATELEDEWSKYIASQVKEGGEPTFEATYTAAQYITMVGILSQLQSFQIVLDDGFVISFDGILKKVGGMQAGNKDLIKMSLTVRISGEPVLTEGTA